MTAASQSQESLHAAGDGGMDLGISERIRPILEQVKNFITDEIIPVEQEYHEEIQEPTIERDHYELVSDAADSK